MPTILSTLGPDWIQLSFDTPVVTVELLLELEARLDEISSSRSELPLILASTHPTIFLAGAHLREISGLDPTTSADYARLGRRVLDRIAGFPNATLAAVGGSVSGGGFDLVLSCDVVISTPGATWSHPGVKRGLVTGWGGSLSLALALGGPTARRRMLEGSVLSASELHHAGWVREIHEQPVVRARSVAGRLRTIHLERLRTWRMLRDGRDQRAFWPVSTRAIIY
jgi:enoyl-CoA hydratase/carnithine racemase